MHTRRHTEQHRFTKKTENATPTTTQTYSRRAHCHPMQRGLGPAHGNPHGWTPARWTPARSRHTRAHVNAKAPNHTTNRQRYITHRKTAQPRTTTPLDHETPTGPHANTQRTTWWHPRQGNHHVRGTTHTWKHVVRGLPCHEGTDHFANLAPLVNRPPMNATVGRICHQNNAGMAILP